MSKFSPIVTALDNLDRLSGPHVRGKTTPELIERSANEAGIKLPASLREWLTFVNGVALPYADLYGIGPDYKADNIVTRYEMIPRYRQEQLLPIGGDGCGNDHVLDLKVGVDPPVLFTESSEDWRPRYVIASNLYHYLQGVVKRSAKQSTWPMDENDVMKMDPNIVKTGYSLPWQV